MKTWGIANNNNSLNSSLNGGGLKDYSSISSGNNIMGRKYVENVNINSIKMNNNNFSNKNINNTKISNKNISNTKISNNTRN